MALQGQKIKRVGHSSPDSGLGLLLEQKEKG